MAMRSQRNSFSARRPLRPAAFFLLELVDQIDEIEEPAACACADDGRGHADAQMGFAGAGPTDEDRVALGVQEIDDRRPCEPAFLQPLGEQAKSGAIPVQRLEVIATLAPKQVQLTAKRISTDHLLNLRREPVEPVPEIDRPARKEHLRPGRQCDHAEPLSARKTRASAFSLTAPSTRTRAPPGSSISIVPAVSS
jgi:hypothetical protein